MPKLKTIYYLKKYHRPLVTSRKAGARVEVLHIDTDMVLANYIDEEPFGSVICCRDEFHKIFQKKPL